MPGKHLSIIERGKVQALVEQGMEAKEIAKSIGRDPSTISRELRQNRKRGGYCAEYAHKKYKTRRKACGAVPKLSHKPLREYVVEKIREDEWTPEEVANRLPLDYPHDPKMRISHEAIYQAIYAQDSLRFLIAFLPQSRLKRRKRGQAKASRRPAIPNRVGIEHRPKEVEDRSQPGHWEGDLIVGKNQDGFIITLVERSFRLLHAIKVKTKHAQSVAQAIIESLLDRPRFCLRTITFDNGREFSHHGTMASVLGVDTYFADPYSSYQRGTNENTNGLIRRFLRKGTSFANLTQRQVDYIVDKLNNRPRKCLGYRTPNEVFMQHRKKALIALET